MGSDAGGVFDLLVPAVVAEGLPELFGVSAPPVVELLPVEFGVPAPAELWLVAAPSEAEPGLAPDELSVCELLFGFGAEESLVDMLTFVVAAIWMLT